VDNERRPVLPAPTLVSSGATGALPDLGGVIDLTGTHTIRVQSSRVQALALRTRRAATELDGVADRVGAALRQIGAAAPGTSLEGRAQEASVAWCTGVTGLARAGDSLAAATQAAAEAYQEVEARGVQRFTGDGMP